MFFWAQGFAILPLEVIVLVGQFLAGQNSLATLASLTVTCKLLEQETTPVLYETVILLGARSFLRNYDTDRELIRSKMNDRRLANFSHTR
jgi:hypothetical protein